VDKNLTVLMTSEEVSAVVKRLAGELRTAYGGGAQAQVPVVIAILNGAFIFTADLVRETALQVEVDFMRLASYGRKDVPADKVCITKDIEVDIKGRDVLIIEDIVDRGLTLKTIIGHLEQKGPKGIKVCSLLLRSTSEQRALVDFVGMSIDEGFVVGYGMDYKEHYRELKGLYILQQASSGGGL
jgi:hypoxanthine phosphoribosyltransferase